MAGACDPVHQDSDFSVVLEPGSTTDWTISDVQIKASACTLDNAIQNQITKHLLSGGEQSINYHTFINSKHDISTSSGLIQVNRSLSRLAAVFVTFDQSNKGANAACYR